MEVETTGEQTAIRPTPYYFKLDCYGMSYEIGFRTHQELITFLCEKHGWAHRFIVYDDGGACELVQPPHIVEEK